MKKLIIFIISFAILISVLIFPVSATYSDSIEIDAPVVYMVSADDDAAVIYNKGANERNDPGEIVKIVTGILVIENCDDLKQKVTASGDAISYVEFRGGTTAGILVGETMTVEELLYCTLVYNAADAAVVLSEFIAGNKDNFVDMMNEFAAKLGLQNTNFTNPVGYNDAEQYSTASEIAAIYKYCIANPTFSQIISTFLYEMPATNKYTEKRYLKNTNNLINSGINDYYFKYVKSGKSGYTAEKNGNSVSVASKDGYNYICVILNAEIKDFDSDGVDENMSFVGAKKLYDWVFDNIKLRVVCNTSTYVCELKVRLSNEYDYISLVPAESVSALVPAGVNAESVYIEPISENTPDTVNAPVKKGDVLGRAAIKYAGSVVAEVDLVADFDIKVSVVKFIGDVIFKIVTHWIFITIVCLTAIVVLPLCIISYRNKQKNLRRKKAKEIKDKRG